jgi:3-dehydroquinate synthase
MKIIKVNLKENSYKIYTGHNTFRNFASYLTDLGLGNFAIAVTSKTVNSKYNALIHRALQKIEHKITVVPDGELAKSPKVFFEVANEIVSVDTWGRKIFLVTLGGGTVGDLGGFIASVYKRGAAYVQVPTTLLAQIDASIGGKTAIDLKAAKNILGTFYQPKAVFIDPLFLKTLPLNQIRQGLAEAIKYSIIRDKNLFNFLMNNRREIISLHPAAILKVIEACVQIKVDIIMKDEREKRGIRTLLNFGHTLAHAMETASKYKEISHGEAVSVGMLYASYLSYRIGLCRKNTFNQIHNILQDYGFQQATLDQPLIHKALAYDKKFTNGQPRMVLVRNIGKVTVEDNLTKNLIFKTLKEFCRKLG